MKSITEDKLISKKKIAKNIGISTTAIDKNINKLKNFGVVNRVGPARGGYWEF
ncbi:MAG: HTH domain-containing protein [Candidatus Cloacimonetes bacterium]|nr:HTH domain-containing protein [Candidatus Cloacimonadota bacterium]